MLMWMVSRPKRGTAIRPSHDRPRQRSSGTPESGRRLGPLDVLVLSAWCGMAAGELEVAARVLYKHWSATNQLYGMTRHFVWVVPLVDLSLFLGMGLSWAVATKLWPRRAGWLGLRFIVAVAILPALLVAGPRIYLVAWLTFALGIASWLAALLERHAAGLRRRLMSSFPVLLGVVLVQAGVIVGGDRLAQSREDGRPLPPSDSPNVLLVVLDTVRADHLSLYGYERRTSPTWSGWRPGGSASTRRARRPPGRSPRTRPCSPADGPTSSTRAGCIRCWTALSRPWPNTWGHYGYATAGFVGNTFYCSYDSGLNRGFTHYDDYIFETLETVRSARLVDIVLKDLNEIGPVLSRYFPMVHGFSREDWSRGSSRSASGRTPGSSIANSSIGYRVGDNRAARSSPSSIISDAHTPYLLPLTPSAASVRARKRRPISCYSMLGLGSTSGGCPEQGQALVRDAYDNCLAYLDTRLGELVDELQRRGVLDRTIVIVTADHGEGLGEHEPVRPWREPLSRGNPRPPRDGPARASAAPGGVGEPVSLRDIPATIADLVSPGTKSPFPAGR